MVNFRSLVLTSVLPAVLVVAASLQALMAVNGEEGLRRAEQLEALKAEKQVAIAKLKSERARLEERADRLILASLDEDLLEERARAQLGYIRPGEYRIPVTELDRVATAEANASTELTNLIAVALLEQEGA